jgi:hypothetical protein
MSARIPTAGVRRAAFVWQFAAAVVLPLWVLTGYAVWGGGVGGFLGISLLAPLLVLAQLGLAVLFTARAAVRRPRMLGLADTGVVAVLTAAVVGVGFFGPATTWFGVLAVAAVLGGFWLGGYELVTEIRTSMRRTLADLGFRPPEPRGSVDAGEYLVIKPSER